MNKIVSKIFLLIVIVFLSSNLYSQDKLEAGINAAKRGDYVKAVELLKVAANSEDNYEGYYYYGMSLMYTGSLKEAERYLNKALQKDNEGVYALIALGNLYSMKKDYSKADTYFKRALKAEPENMDVLLSQAKNYTVAGKIDDAITALTFATTIS